MSTSWTGRRVKNILHRFNSTSHGAMVVIHFFQDSDDREQVLPLNSHPRSECGTERLDVSTKSLVKLIFTGKEQDDNRKQSSQRTWEHWCQKCWTDSRCSARGLPLVFVFFLLEWRRCFCQSGRPAVRRSGTLRGSWRSSRVLLELESRRSFLEDRTCLLQAFLCSDWRHSGCRKVCMPPQSFLGPLADWRSSFSCPSQFSNFRGKKMLCLIQFVKKWPPLPSNCCNSVYCSTDHIFWRDSIKVYTAAVNTKVQLAKNIKTSSY